MIQPECSIGITKSSAEAVAGKAITVMSSLSTMTMAVSPCAAYSAAKCRITAVLKASVPTCRASGGSLRIFQFYGGGQGATDPEGATSAIGQQPVDQLPWGHNILIFTKCTSIEEAH